MSRGAAMSNDEVQMWQKAAEDITTPRVLARIADHNRAVVSNVGTVGALLGGLGGLTAAVSATQSPFSWHGVPVVQIGALLTSVLAGSAVGVALLGRRPAFAALNTHNILEVREWYRQEVGRGKKLLRIASWLLVAAVTTAVVTSAAAGLQAVLDGRKNPHNALSLSATSGEGGAVVVQLAGSVDGLDADEHLVVAVRSDVAASQEDLVSVQVHPDADDRATLDSSARAPVGSTRVTADVWVLRQAETPVMGAADFVLTASFPEVPASD